MMRTEALVERLAGDLRPRQPRSVVREAIILAVLGIIELGAFLGMGFMRPDMPHALQMPSFWWKLTSMGLIAGLGTGVAVLSVDPTRSPRRGLRWMLACVVLIFASGWMIDALRQGWSHFLARLDCVLGVQCVWQMVVLSLPAVIALSILIRRGAPTDRSGTALAAGLASAAWGAFVFVFACPSDDPLYIAVWYTASCAIVTLAARTVVLRLTRW